MSLENFNKALKWLGPIEGGYVNNPKDRGGATNKGVTQANYNRYRNYKKLPPQDVRLITVDEAREVYQIFFWQPSYGWAFDNYGLAVALFDTLVQFVPRSFIGFLTKLTGCATVRDSITDLKNLTSDEQTQAALRLCDLRIAFRHAEVLRNPSQQTFLQGWINRDNKLKKEISNG